MCGKFGRCLNLMPRFLSALQGVGSLVTWMFCMYSGFLVHGICF